MPYNEIIYFDIAAVIIMAVSLFSLVFRGLTRGSANRVYLTAITLVTITAVLALAGDVYDAFIAASLTHGISVEI